jgi:hypothetical protein
MGKKKAKHLRGNSKMFNFRADKATLEAIDKLVAAYVPGPGDLSGASKSRAIRGAILAAAAKIGSVTK